MSFNKEVEAMATSTWLSSDIVNASLDNVPLLHELKEQGNFMRVDFGDDIKVSVNLSRDNVSATDPSGSGMNKQTDRVAFAPTVQFKTVPAKLILKKDAIDLEQSEEKKVSWVLNEMVASQSSIINSLNSMLYGDGTTDSGYSLDGLALAVAKEPSLTPYAGIDSTTVEAWRNISYNTLDSTSELPSAGEAMSEANILERIRVVINRLTSNGDTPTHIFVGDRWFDFIEKSLEEKQRIVSVDGQDPSAGYAGFRSLYYKGVKVCNSGGLARSSEGGIFRGMPENVMYILNLKKIYFAYHNPYINKLSEIGLSENDINAVVYPEMASGSIIHKSEATLDYYVDMVFKGNLLVSDRGSQAVIYEEVIEGESKTQGGKKS